MATKKPKEPRVRRGERLKYRLRPDFVAVVTVPVGGLTETEATRLGRFLEVMAQPDPELDGDSSSKWP